MTPELLIHFNALAKDANEHSHGCNDPHCTAYRVEMVAQLMDYLGLSLEDLGYIAESWLDIQCDVGEPQDCAPDILDAKEIE